MTQLPGYAGGLLLLLAAAVQAQERVIGAFSESSLAGWEAEVFSGRTQYDLVEEPEVGTVLHARCSDAASGLWRRIEVDLRETPVLEWSWRVDQTFSGIDETVRAGDDYPARVYVVVDGGWRRWRTRAINYVWASEKPAGADWPNAYASQARMLAVRSGSPEVAGQWRRESRNVREDFRRYHGRDVEQIDAVAIMTDCDDTGGEAEAWYGDIRFIASPQD